MCLGLDGLSGDFALRAELTLRELVATENYELVICDHPHLHPDSLGDPDSDFSVVLLSGGRLACRTAELSFENLYGAAHEISEAYWGRFEHFDLLWQMQCNLLAHWAWLLAGYDPLQGLYHVAPLLSQW